MNFAHPIFFIFLLLIPFLLKKTPRSFFYFPGLSRLGQSPHKPKKIDTLRWLRILTFIFLVLALARPQKGNRELDVLTEGIDMMIALDTSGSMRAIDFEINDKRVTRLEALKKVVHDFIEKRPGDRLGLVVFGEEAFTQAPLTLDHDLLQSFLKELQIGMAGEKTAVGSALAISSQRLKDLSAKSKVIILVTDGSSNSGNLSPIQAAEAAASLGIKVYTIGIGSNGPVPFLEDGLFGQHIVYQEADLDEDTLKKIASTTQARYFRAHDTEELFQIYQEIDRLEKTEAKTKEYIHHEEWFRIPATLALITLILEMVLSQTWLRRLPT